MSFLFTPIRLTMKMMSHYIGLSESEINKKCNPNDAKYDESFPKKVHDGNKSFFITKEVDIWVLKQAEKNRTV